MNEMDGNKISQHFPYKLCNQAESQNTLLTFSVSLLTLVRQLIVLAIECKLVLSLTVILVPVIYIVYKCYLVPDLIVRDVTQIGYNHIARGPDRVARIERAQAARKLGSKVPPPYPNGWFAVAESRDLKVGGVKAVDVLGQNLCVYRGEDGIARCVDAYCPHLGANMAVGGTVRGGCIECPFHRWWFDGEGELASVPNVEIVPKGVSVRSWSTSEADGAVWVWHDAEGRPPLWTLSDAEELAHYSYRGRNEFQVSCHIQEIPENGADVAHLNAVHAQSLISSWGEKYPLLQHFIGAHHWTAAWSRHSDHTASIALTHDYRILKLNLFHFDVNVTQIGPGHVRLRVQSPLGPLLISQSVTPVAPARQLVVHRMFSPAWNAPLALFMNRAESYMFERDVAIWNSKRYVSSPTYTKTDKNIKAFRTWYSQFYSERSVSFRDAHQNNLEW